MLHAFGGMHAKGELPTLAPDDLMAETALVTLVDGLESAADQDPDLYRKTLRIKSSRAYNWLLNESTVYSLLICNLTNQFLERVMFTLMRWQRDETWLTVGEAPIILMSNPETSPAVTAVKQLFALMNFDQVGESGLVLEELLQGYLGFSLETSCFGLLIVRWLNFNHGTSDFVSLIYVNDGTKFTLQFTITLFHIIKYQLSTREENTHVHCHKYRIVSFCDFWFYSWYWYTIYIPNAFLFLQCIGYSTYNMFNHRLVSDVVAWLFLYTTLFLD